MYIYYLPFPFNSEEKYLLNTDVFLFILIHCSINGSISLFIFFFFFPKKMLFSYCTLHLEIDFLFKCQFFTASKKTHIINCCLATPLRYIGIVTAAFIGVLVVLNKLFRCEIMLFRVWSKQVLITIHIFLIKFFLPDDLIRNCFQLYEFEPFKAQRGCTHTHTHTHRLQTLIYVCVRVCEHWGVRAGVCLSVHCAASHRWLGFYYVYTKQL